VTWVLAKPFVQGYTLTIADVCVTYTEPGKAYQYKDCLQKVHPISPKFGLLVGFAGNVRNAFKIVDDMRSWCEKYEEDNPGVYLDIDTFIPGWRNSVNESKKFQYVEDNQIVHLTVAGTIEYIGSPDPKIKGLSKVFVLKSTDSYRLMSVHPFKWHSIGSGSEVEICKKILDELSEDFRFRLLALDSDAESVASSILPMITNVLVKELKDKGISTLLTVGITSVASTNLGIIYKERGKDGKPIIPVMCSTYPMLEAYLKNSGIAVAADNLQAESR
jgi:hypothetical protein